MPVNYIFLPTWWARNPPSLPPGPPDDGLFAHWRSLALLLASVAGFKLLVCHGAYPLLPFLAWPVPSQNGPPPEKEACPPSPKGDPRCVRRFGSFAGVAVASHLGQTNDGCLKAATSAWMLTSSSAQWPRRCNLAHWPGLLQANFVPGYRSIRFVAYSPQTKTISLHAQWR